MKKKLLSILICLSLLVTLLPQLTLPAHAETYSGTCGDNLTWTLDANTGKLAILGSGRMTDFNMGNLPWHSYKSIIKTVSIAYGVTSIGNMAFFNCSNLTSVTIPNSITSIGNCAFYCCISLPVITIPKSVINIGYDAFMSCTNLKSISVASGNPNYSSDSGVLFNKRRTELIRCPEGFKGSYNIPVSVTSIRWKGFGECAGITAVTIPNKVKSIGDYTFFRCTSLRTVTIPTSVASIGDYTFCGCTSLTRLTINNPNCSIGSQPTTLGDASITTIYSVQGSTAEQYAETYGFQFEALGYTVTFDLNGGTGNIPGQTVPEGGYAFCPDQVPVRPGYIFDGWYSAYALSGNASGNYNRLPWFNYYNNYRGYAVTGNVTLYAKWKEREFSYYTDTFSFENTWLPKYHDLPSMYYAYLAQGLSKNERTNLYKLIYGTGGKRKENKGSCFGMSAVLCSVFANQLNPSFFQNGAACLYDLELDNNNIVNNNVYYLIEYYQFLQSIGRTLTAREQYNRLDETPNNQAIITALKSSSFPVLVGLNLYERTPLTSQYDYQKLFGRHAVVAYDFIETANEYRVSIWDPNDYTFPNILHISKDYSISYFEKNYDSGDYSTYITFALTVESNDYNYANLQKRLMKDGYSSVPDASRKDTAFTSEDQWLKLTTNYESFLIKGPDGKTATVMYGVKTEGDLEITDAVPMNEIHASQLYEYDLPILNEGEYYTITPSDEGGVNPEENLEEYTTELLYDDSSNGFYCSASVSCPCVLCFGWDGRVTTDNNSSVPHIITVCRNDTTAPWYRVEICGSTAGITVTPAASAVQAWTSDDAVMDFYVSDDTNTALLSGISITSSGVSLVEDVQTPGRATIICNEETVQQADLGNTVIFFTANGSPVDAQRDIPSGECAVQPENPTRTGYIFDGWYTGTDYLDEQLWSFNTPVTENISLYAKWIEDPAFIHTVTFRAEGMDDIVYVVYNGDSLSAEAIPELPDPAPYCRSEWDVTEFNEINSDILVTPIYFTHEYSDAVEDPTCTANGLATYTCTECGDVWTEELPALGHDFEDGTCVRCGRVEPERFLAGLTDVSHNAYYWDALVWAVNAEPQITNGTTMTTFSPNKTCTRAQVVTFLWRAAGCPEPSAAESPFLDLSPDAYCYPAVLWAVENGITTGTSSVTFSPNQTCTRAQIVTFLWRAAGTPEPSSAQTPFRDLKASAYYYKAALWAVEQHITVGTTAITFSPKRSCSRAQTITFLWRFMGNLDFTFKR